jgi:3D (Asp-Asp-Asp) domain-containing protein
MGIYVVEDTMHPRWARKADIWFHDLETARRWGVRQVYLARVEAETPLLVAPQWHS